MKKFLALVLAAAIGLALTTAPARAKTWSLRFTSPYMDTHPTVINGFLPWFEQIREATGGQVKIRNFNPNTICPEGEIFASVISGAIDLGGSYHPRIAGKFPLHDVFSLPLVAGSSEAMAETAWKLYGENPALQKEMEEVVVLGYWASAPLQLHTVDRQIKTMDDLKGLRIIGWSKTSADMLSAWGANPVIVAAPETYLALSRHQADGVLCPLAPFRSFKLNEATRYTTLGNFGMETFYMAVNKERWNGFPEDVRNAIRGTLGNDWPQRTGRTLDEGARADTDILTKAGHIFYSLPAEELARMTQAVAPLDQAWLDRVVKLGVLPERDAQELLWQARSSGAKISARLASEH